MTAPKIGFLGSMNSMPMGYALKFVRDGFDVRYVVESAPDNYLMRPEHQYPQQIRYPYPDWIREHRRPYSIVAHALAPLAYRKALHEMHDRDVVFVNDWGLALAPWLSARTLVVALSSGSDIDIYCNYASVWGSLKLMRRKWLLPAALVLQLLRAFNQRRGLRRCDVISYFQSGLNPTGDALVAEAAACHAGVREVRRYDMNFAASGAVASPIPERKLTKVLVPVRFHINPPSWSSFEYKGNDRIIRALARYRARNPDIEVHLFKKGPPADVELGRALCRELGLEANVVWHDEMSVAELLALYRDSDVCFDQVGSHWLGAVGGYALYIGRPLIANARPDVFRELWGDDPPILHATDEEQIYAQLVACEDYAFRLDLAERGREFARRVLDSERVYQQFRTCIAGLRGDALPVCESLPSCAE